MKNNSDFIKHYSEFRLIGVFYIAVRIGLFLTADCHFAVSTLPWVHIRDILAEKYYFKWSSLLKVGLVSDLDWPLKYTLVL